MLTDCAKAFSHKPFPFIHIKINSRIHIVGRPPWLWNNNIKYILFECRSQRHFVYCFLKSIPDIGRKYVIYYHKPTSQYDCVFCWQQNHISYEIIEHASGHISYRESVCCCFQYMYRTWFVKLHCAFIQIIW